MSKLTDVETELRKIVEHTKEVLPHTSKVCSLAADIVHNSGKAQHQRDTLAGYLCRIKLPLPAKLVAALTKQFPGETIRMKDEDGYLCIYDTSEQAGT